MARRDVYTPRTVTQIVPEAIEAPVADGTLNAIADIGTEIIRAGQEAKITENFSKAQLELSQLNTQYEIDYQGDPFGGLDKLKNERQKIYDRYGSDISPFFKKPWMDSTRELEVKNEGQTKAWAFQQTRKNTVASINRSIKNNLSQASLDGENFGNSDETEFSSFVNFAQSKKQLMGFADKNLGSETATSMLEDYDEDYLKSFVSGVSESNPLKALRMMDDPKVKASFRDHKQYAKMRESVENRALNVQEINSQKEILGTLKDENSLLTRSLEKPISYTELQSEFDRVDMSPASRKFFMKANGYTKADGEEKLSQAEQLQYKVDLYDDIAAATSDPNFTPEKIKGIQERIYNGMNRAALSEKDGIDFLNQLIGPSIEKKEEELSKFQKNNWFTDDIGFSGLQKMYGESIEIKPAEGEEEVGPVTKAVNNENKAKLYDYYKSALQAESEPLGIPYVTGGGR